MIGIVLLNWRAAEDTTACARALESQTCRDWRLWVVDNDSGDGSEDRLRRALPNATVLQSGANLGFASGMNTGIRAALADAAVETVLILNSDTEADPELLGQLQAGLERHPRAAAAGPKIYYAHRRDLLWAAGGEISYRETVTRERGKGESDRGQYDREEGVGYLTSCCLLFRRQALESVGLLDPAYFINADDADWCVRAKGANWEILYVPSGRLWHRVAASTQGSYTPLKTFHTGRSNAIFVRKHGGAAGMLRFLAANAITLPLAFARELPRGNGRAVVAKLEGILAGLRSPVSPVCPL